MFHDSVMKHDRHHFELLVLYNQMINQLFFNLIVSIYDIYQVRYDLEKGKKRHRLQFSLKFKYPAFSLCISLIYACIIYNLCVDFQK